MDLHAGRASLAGSAHVSRTTDPANRHQRRALVQLAGQFGQPREAIFSLWQNQGQLVKTRRRRDKSRHRQGVSAITERQLERHRQVPSTFRLQAIALKSDCQASACEVRPMIGLQKTLIRFGTQIDAQIIDRRP